jgi:nitroreductase
MELYDVMRTTSAVREFTTDPLPDDILYRILDNARFAPSGGNRQAAHIIVVRDATVRQQLAELAVPGARRYVAQIQAVPNPGAELSERWSRRRHRCGMSAHPRNARTTRSPCLHGGGALAVSVPRRGAALLTGPRRKPSGSATVLATTGRLI